MVLNTNTGIHKIRYMNMCIQTFCQECMKTAVGYTRGHQHEGDKRPVVKASLGIQLGGNPLALQQLKDPLRHCRVPCHGTKEGRG